ncbi:MAG: hypothetical protein AB1846_12420 [Chloroflexota bacterium]
MKTRLFHTCSLLLFALLVTACGGRAAASDGSPVEDLAGLDEALRDAGATVEMGEPVEQAFFAVPGQILRVNGADVQVYEYETAEAMEADAALVAPDGGSVGTSMVTWVAAPHFYKSGRILVLYVGEDGAVIELLERLLGSQFAGR